MHMSFTFFTAACKVLSFHKLYRSREAALLPFGKDLKADIDQTSTRTRDQVGQITHKRLTLDNNVLYGNVWQQ